jgi:outer membrane lipoprotein LolB
LLNCRTGPVTLRAAAGMVLLLLAACATTPPAPVPETLVPPPDWPARRDALMDVNDWTVNGRVAMRDGHDAWSANVHWVQNRDAYDVSLYGPLGQGTVQLQGDDSGGELHTADNKQFRAADMEDLLYRELGWRIPVDGLRYWARGVPVPDAPKQYGFDAHGRLAWLEQFGWHVAFLRYTNVNNITLPKRIDVTRKTLTVKLVVDQWKLPHR